MLTIRFKTLVMGACVLTAIWLLVAQTVGNILLLLPCLACFLALVAWAAFKRMALPVLLFFLPFAPLLKIQPGTISFFTIALMAVYLVYTITGNRNVPILHLIPGLCLVMLTVVVKTLSGFSLDNSFFLFCIILLVAPYIAAEFRDGCDFYWLTMIFSVGIALAAISAQYLTSFSAITQYIVVNTSSGMIRWSGYYGDPNFYSAHITVALSGMLLLLLNRLRKKEIVWLVLQMVVMIYCGLLSVSKSFLLVTLSMVLFWVVGLMFQRGKISVKIMVILCAVVGVYFLISSAMFDVLLSRFVGVSNMSAFTTGRTELWASYVTAITEDPMLLLFGVGYTDIVVGGDAAHNTLIQLVFQFGLVGCALLIAWFVFFVRVLLSGVRIHRTKLTQLAIVLIGAFGPWMALDYLFFDEFFLFPIYVCAAIRFMAQQEPGESPLIEQKSVGE